MSDPSLPQPTLFRATTGATITVVNGVGNAGTRADNVTPVNGEVTFTINASVAVSVVPVVYTDANPPVGNNGLDLTAPTPANALPEAPSDAFGIGGMKTWVPAEATAFTTVPAGEVIAVYADEQAYSLDNGYGGAPAVDGDGIADVLVKWTTGDTFASDNNDAINAAEQAISLAQFAAWISAGDEIGQITGYNPGAVHPALQGDHPSAATAVTEIGRAT